MTYLYEQLSPEKFQHLCQSILVSQFPNVQCLPVAQPDGGRDAFTWSINPKSNKRDLIVFQVKFMRNPENADKRFVENIIQGELPKVQALKERGIGGYYLLTNALGSAHLDVGSV